MQAQPAGNGDDHGGREPVALRCTEFVGEALVITSPALSVLRVASVN